MSTPESQTPGSGQEAGSKEQGAGKGRELRVERRESTGKPTLNSELSTLNSPGLTARERSRLRKVIYLVAIIVLVVVIFKLSAPATLGTQKAKGQPEAKGQPGGVLAQYRDKHGLGQTELGEIDPTSETVRLATLGMRGVGSSLLWWSASQQQMKKDWTQLRATLDQISKFQPHSVQVWKYQAWNLSYNVSVAFDDYHDKFYWVIEGLNYLLDGVRLNDKEPRLYWDMGWFISNKIGRADEAKYYRRLFAGKKDVSESGAEFRRPSVNGARAAGWEDAGIDFAPDYVKDFRERDIPPTGFPHGSDVLDNWHVGKAWFLAAESKIDPPRYPVRGMADVIFYSDAPTCQFYYADALEKDGRFDQVAANAWKQASREWSDFGERAIDTCYDLKLQLNHKEELDAAIARDVEALDKLAPGQRQKLYEEKFARLTPEEREAWTTPVEKRTPQQHSLMMQIGERMEVKNEEVAHRATTSPRVAEKLAKVIETNKNLSLWTNRERMKVNFDFWKTRAAAEQSDECIAARKAIHDGDEAFAKGDQIRARPYYEKGMQGWRRVLDKYPLLVDDPNLGNDLLDVVHHYQKCLDQDDLDLPKPFVLQDIVTKWEKH